MIKIQARNGYFPVLQTNLENAGFKSGDLVEESFLGSTEKSIIVGIDFDIDNNPQMWTGIKTCDSFILSGYYRKKDILGHVKLIKRPKNPDLTIEGLERSLDKFILERHWNNLSMNE